MTHLPIEPEEMQMRVDEDIHAMLDMIGEGSPVFESYTFSGDNGFKRKNHQWDNEESLPETYQ